MQIIERAGGRKVILYPRPPEDWALKLFTMSGQFDGIRDIKSIPFAECISLGETIRVACGMGGSLVGEDAEYAVLVTQKNILFVMIPQ